MRRMNFDEKNRPLKVFINPGHDRMVDPGACGNGLEEADVVWDVGILVKKYLEHAGVEVVDCFQDDDLGLVCESANSMGADVFISIHCNAVESRQANGVETFCFRKGTSAETLAECIQSQITNRFFDLTDRGIKVANFYVLRSTDMPAVLVELAFITNELDANKLRYYKDDFARAIARGVTDYQLMVGVGNE